MGILELFGESVCKTGPILLTDSSLAAVSTEFKPETRRQGVAVIVTAMHQPEKT